MWQNVLNKFIPKFILFRLLVYSVGFLVHYNIQGVHKYSKIYEVPEYSRRQKGGVKQVPYWRPTIIRHHRAQCRWHGGLAPGICTSLTICTYNAAMQEYMIVVALVKWWWLRKPTQCHWVHLDSQRLSWNGAQASVVRGLLSESHQAYSKCTEWAKTHFF